MSINPCVVKDEWTDKYFQENHSHNKELFNPVKAVLINSSVVDQQSRFNDVSSYIYNDGNSINHTIDSSPQDQSSFFKIEREKSTTSLDKSRLKNKAVRILQNSQVQATDRRDSGVPNLELAKHRERVPR